MNHHLAYKLVVILALVTLCGVAFAQAPDLGALIKDTQLKYEEMKVTGDALPSWRLPFDGQNGKTIDVFVTYNDDQKKFALIFSTVVDRENNFTYNRETLVEAMKLSNDYPGTKFVLDEDHGDIDCQTEVYMQTINAESLGMYINLVASMSDDHAAKLNQLAGGAAPAEGAAPATAVPTAVEAPVDPINWLPSYEQALAAAKQQGKPLIVDFFGVNCGACERMDGVTYVDPDVVAQKDKFLFVKVDVAQREDLMKKYNVAILPTTVVLSAQGQELRRADGYLDPPAMLKLLAE